MWSRKEVKQRAKEKLKKYYWMAFLACLLAGILGAGDRIAVNFQTNSGSGSSGVSNGLVGQMGVPNPAASVVMAAIAFLGILSVIIFAAGVLFKIFVSNVMTVGRCRYFLESRHYDKSADFGLLFWGFKNGYMNIVSVMFLRDLYVFLWTLALLIPGIVKGYQYHMIPWLLADDPYMTSADAFEITKEMTDGMKMDLFVLDLSFIGWILLGNLLCGIGVLFVDPYYQAVAAEVYSWVKDSKSWYNKNNQTIEGGYYV